MSNVDTGEPTIFLAVCLLTPVVANSPVAPHYRTHAIRGAETGKV